MEYYRKKFKHKSQQDAVSVLTEKEYKYASLQAISNQTILENNEKQLKELLEEVNSHLTDLRCLLEDPEVYGNAFFKIKCEKLLEQFENCLVKLVNKDATSDESAKLEKDDEPIKVASNSAKESEPPVNKLGQKVGRNELEEKLKQMRQKRLSRLSTFVNEQAKLSEQRSEIHERTEEIEENSTLTETVTNKTQEIQEKEVATSSELNMFHRSGSTSSKVTDIRSSFGKGGVHSAKKNLESEKPEKTAPKLPSKIATKPNFTSKSIESPKSPSQKRRFFNSISNCLSEETKDQTDKIIEENDKLLNEMKHVQLKKVTTSNNNLQIPNNSSTEIRKPTSPITNRWKLGLSRLSDSDKDVSKNAPKAVAVAPPTVGCIPNSIQPFSSRSKSDLHEHWKNKSTTVTQSSSLKNGVKNASNTDLNFIRDSVKRNSKESEHFERIPNERCSFTTFRAGKDSIASEEFKMNRKSSEPVYTTLEFSDLNRNKPPPKREKVYYEVIDLTKTAEHNTKEKYIENNLEISKIAIEKSEYSEIETDKSNEKTFEKSLQELLRYYRVVEKALKNQNPEHVANMIASSRDLQEINVLFYNLNMSSQQKNETDKQNQDLSIFSNYREQLSNLGKQVQSFKGLRRDLQYLILSSNISKIYLDVKNIDCPSKEHEKRRHSFLEKVNDLEKDLENRMNRNEELLFEILEEQAKLIGGQV